MSTKPNNVGECIKEFITAIEVKGTVFSALMQEYHVDNDESLFQFTVAQPAPCLQSATFIKETGQDRLGNVTLEFSGDATVAELTKTFGEFRNTPPDPSGYCSAIARYKSASESQRYALIIEQKGAITPETAVRRISLRIDYMD
ncbi:MAG: hypothetical protein U0176_02000 [Bacteroidia bacterium]